MTCRPLRVRSTWAREIRTILEQCNMLDYYAIDVSGVSSTNFVVNKVRTELQRLSALSWQQSLEMSPKLQTCKTYKTQMVTRKYLFRYMSIKQRSFYVKFRCGTIPINIELERYRNPKIPLDNRFCKVCERHATEDEKHFLSECSGYHILRHELFTNLNIYHLTDDEKILYCLKEADCKLVSNVLIKAYKERNVRLSRK